MKQFVSIDFFKKRKKTMLLIFSVIAITITLHILISLWLIYLNNTYFPSIGTIRTINIEVYGKDIKTQDSKKFIDWGMVYPGVLANRTFNVTSKSNIQAVLIIRATNWTFYDSSDQIVEVSDNKANYMSLTSSQNKTIITPNQTLELTLILNVTASREFINFLIEKNVRKFSFDIHIYVKETT
jgi:hypothetical protein